MPRPPERCSQITAAIYAYFAHTKDAPRAEPLRLSTDELDLFKAMVDHAIAVGDFFAPNDHRTITTINEDPPGSWRLFGRLVCHEDGTPYADPAVIARSTE